MGEKKRDDKDPAALAKEAMERAREGARQRGSGRKPAEVAARERTTRRKARGADPTPYGKGREPVSVGGEVSRVIERMGWTEQIEMASVGARWGEIVGDEIAQHCAVVAFEGGVLTLRASSTAWAEQLLVVSGNIRQRVNEEIGRPVVTTIRVERPSTRSWVKGQRTVKGRGPRDTYG
ncbi:MAG: DciA family protein [Demequinaceae bacterium]|nr:DciA family protein [Demequinaceae bacterium]